MSPNTTPSAPMQSVDSGSCAGRRAARSRTAAGKLRVTLGIASQAREALCVGGLVRELFHAHVRAVRPVVRAVLTGRVDAFASTPQILELEQSQGRRRRV